MDYALEKKKIKDEKHSFTHSSNIYQAPTGASPIAGVRVACGIHASPSSHRAPF